MKRFFALILVIFTLSSINGQDYKGTLPFITKDGFYLVLLDPDLCSASKSNSAYFRIIDSHENEVPYVYYQALDENNIHFIELPIISKSTQMDSFTSVEIENKNLNALNNISLFISNTSITKSLNVSGSDDRENWFGLVQNQLLTNIYDEKSGQVEKVILFPLNNYRYLKIDFSNLNSLPINVLNAGIYRSEINYVRQLELSGFEHKIVHDKVKRKTLIYISFDSPQAVSELSLDIHSNLYLRNATIWVERSRKVKKRNKKFRNQIASFTINSALKSVFEIPTIFEKDFVIEIENQDNPPLNIQGISLFQKPVYALVYLKTSQKYTVIVDTSLSKPTYDLQHFQPENIKNIEVLDIDNFTQIKADIVLTKNLKFRQSKWFLWISLIVGCVIITWFTWKLIKDLEK
jgi:hypothetical protein